MFVRKILQFFKKKPDSTLSLEDVVYLFDRNRKVKIDLRNTGIVYEGPGVEYENETEIRKFYAILDSMTATEKTNPEKLSANRLIKIATGSGTNLEDVKLLIDSYNLMKMEINKLISKT